MTTVQNLVPGDLVENSGASALFVAQTEHPIWPSLQLVIWRMPDGSWSHDALDARQDVGQIAADQVGNVERLRKALLS